MDIIPQQSFTPDGAVRCLLCDGIIGGREKYDRHLLSEHMVFFNRSWVVDQTFSDTVQPNLENENDEETSQMSAKKILPNEESVNYVNENDSRDSVFEGKTLDTSFGEPSHDCMRNWVNSALRRSRVNVKNCHYKINDGNIYSNNDSSEKRSNCDVGNSTVYCQETTGVIYETIVPKLVVDNNKNSKAGNTLNHVKIGDQCTSSILPSKPLISVHSDSCGSSPTPLTSAATGHAKGSVEEFVYQCPFPRCNFYTDYNGMKTGSAAKHGVAEHQISPRDFKTRGLKWRKMSLNKLRERERVM